MRQEASQCGTFDDHKGTTVSHPLQGALGLGQQAGAMPGRGQQGHGQVAAGQQDGHCVSFRSALRSLWKPANWDPGAGPGSPLLLPPRCHKLVLKPVPSLGDGHRDAGAQVAAGSVAVGQRGQAHLDRLAEQQHGLGQRVAETGKQEDTHDQFLLHSLERVERPRHALRLRQQRPHGDVIALQPMNVEKGGGGDGDSSVQLFNNWRNSRALENSLKERQSGATGSDPGGTFESRPIGGTPSLERTGLPGVAVAFARFGAALRLDEGVDGSLKKLPAETAVQLGNGVSWGGGRELRKNCRPSGVKSQRRQSGMGLVSGWLATLSAQLNR
ncbi:hypothetical protein EYF80_031305 [Liparis tanakae]|uniref:Uncharacterized protein n=1 Tax=Liparis tanakae TaxID=230148 RepID=A0A4Z2H0T5_9TELE|nr:hypothetical protein EYF80_031305 [Liparis tanakae]